jgi:putative phosphoesterase
VLEELRELAPVAAVHGNVDEADLRTLLPAALVVELAGVRIGVVHDSGARAGRARRLIARFPGCAAVVYGHSHLPELALADGVWLLNPGSPTERRRAPRHTMIRLQIEAQELEPMLVELD